MARTRVRERRPPTLNVEERLFSRAARLHSVGPEHAVWRDAGHAIRYLPNVEGDFVRLEAPGEAADEEVEAVRKVLEEKMGALVRLVPRRRGAAAPEPEVAAGPDRTAREVVAELVEEVPSKDRQALRTEVESVVSEAGV